MSGQMSFGQVLRNARESKGIQVNEAARRLRIRPDIVRALEASDFSRIPPKGYARNMVNAYARYLGLNATDVTRMYLDEAYAHQLGKQAGASRGTGFNMPASRTRAGSAREEARAKREARNAEARGERGDSYEGYSRNASSYSRSRNTRAALTGYSASSSSNRSSRSSRVQGAEQYAPALDTSRYQSRAIDRPSRGTNQFGREVYDGRPDVYQRGAGLREGGFIEAPARSRRGVPAGGFSSGGFSGGYGNRAGGLASKLPIIAIVVVVLVVVVIVANMLLNRGGEQPSTNVANLPITGISDTSGTNDNLNTDSATPTVTVAPTCSVLTYQVKSGQAAYVEIYLDGSDKASVADTIAGPNTSEMQFSGKIRFVTANRDGVVVKVDGTEVTLKDENNTGVYEYNADFADILAEWQKAHVAAANSAANSAASNGNANGNSNNTGNGNSGSN